jgi:hypothetical protein
MQGALQYGFEEMNEASETPVLFVLVLRLFDDRLLKFTDVPAKEGVYLPSRG